MSGNATVSSSFFCREGGCGLTGRRGDGVGADDLLPDFPGDRVLFAGEAEFRLPGTVHLNDLPIALGDTRRIKGTACRDLSGDREGCDANAIWAKIGAEHRCCR